MPTEISSGLQQQIESETARLLVNYLQEGARRNAGGLENALTAADLTVGRYNVRDLDLLLRLSYLLSPDTAEFLSFISRGLRSIRTSSKRHSVELNGTVRGSIDWAQTVPRQVVYPTSYICTDIQRSFDLPENRILAALIEQMASDAVRVSRGLGAARKTENPGGWRANLDFVRDTLSQVRRNPYYRLISPAPSATSSVPARLRARCRRSALACATLAEIDIYQCIMNRSLTTAEARRRLLEGFRWPEPHKGFELFVLFRLVDLLHDGAQTAELVPIGAKGERWFMRLRHGPAMVTVYYQVSPADATLRYHDDTGDRSIDDYARVLTAYGKQFAQLRPDVTIEALDTRTGKRRIALVEVKHSEEAATCGQGLRELVDYRLLFECAGADVESVRGLLCVLGAPDLNVELGNLMPFDHAHAITTAARLLAGNTPELEALLAFCWFRNA